MQLIQVNIIVPPVLELPHFLGNTPHPFPPALPPPHPALSGYPLFLRAFQIGACKLHETL